MKQFKPILAAVFYAVVFCASCGGSDDEQEPELSARQKAAGALSESAWGGAGKVQVTPPDAEIEESAYADLMDLKLNFDADDDFEPGSFTSTGGGDFFPDVSTTWSWSSFSGASGNVIAIAEGAVTQLTSFSFIPDVENASSITFTFNYSGSGDARVSDVTGDYTVTLNK